MGNELEELRKEMFDGLDELVKRGFIKLIPASESTTGQGLLMNSDL